jgi:hypothetical protein
MATARDGWEGWVSRVTRKSEDLPIDEAIACTSWRRGRRETNPISHTRMKYGILALVYWRGFLLADFNVFADWPES